MKHFDDYEDDLIDNSEYENCPDCEKWFDEIDYDFQICSRCNWDGSK